MKLTKIETQLKKILVSMIKIPYLKLGGRASSKMTRRCCPAVPSIRPKAGWSIAHSAHPPFTPLLKVAFNQKVLMDLSFPQTDKPFYFPGLKF